MHAFAGHTRPSAGLYPVTVHPVTVHLFCGTPLYGTPRHGRGESGGPVSRSCRCIREVVCLAFIGTIRSSYLVSLLPSTSLCVRPKRPSRILFLPHVLLLPHVVGVLILFAVIASGCESGTGTPPDVETGRFEAELDGAFDRSVTGAARYRMTDDNLTGLELVIDSASGMSVELEPGPIRQTTYQVVEWELLSVDRPGGRPGTVAFLETPGGSFESVDGMLDIIYQEDDAIGGTFEFEMNGTLENLPGEPYGLSARGRWIATPLLVD